MAKIRSGTTPAAALGFGSMAAQADGDLDREEVHRIAMLLIRALGGAKALERRPAAQQRCAGRAARLASAVRLEVERICRARVGGTDDRRAWRQSETG